MSDRLSDERIAAILHYSPERAESVVLAREVQELRAWKAEATTVLKQWDDMWEAIGRPGVLGHSKSEGVRAEVERLTMENARDRMQFTHAFGAERALADQLAEALKQADELGWDSYPWDYEKELPAGPFSWELAKAALAAWEAARHE